MCHHACQQTQQPARSGEGRVTTDILTIIPVSKVTRKGEDTDAKKQRKINVQVEFLLLNVSLGLTVMAAFLMHWEAKFCAHERELKACCMIVAS